MRHYLFFRKQTIAFLRATFFSLLFAVSVLVIAVLVSFSVLLAHAELPTTEMASSASAAIAELSRLVAEPPKIRDDLKRVGDYRKDLKTFVKRSKEKEDQAQRLGAIVDLCLLHDQLVNDPRFKINEQLIGFRAIAATRLKKCQREIELELKRADRESPFRNKSGNSKTPGVHNSPGETPELISPQTDETYVRCLIDDMQSITQLSGGPIRLWNYTNGNLAPLCDYGPDLVRLIETTINPDFWRTNGGTGIIEYYQPLRILVISASSRIHDDLTDLLRTIRANGR